MPSEEEMAAMEAYVGRVNGLLITVGETVPPEALMQAQSLIDHGEPAEGLLATAWIITNGGYRVPRWVVDGIREMSAGLVPPEMLPADLDEHVS